MLIDNEKLKLKATRYIINNGYEFPATLNNFRALVLNTDQFEDLAEATREQFEPVQTWVEDNIINTSNPTN